MTYQDLVSKLIDNFKLTIPLVKSMPKLTVIQKKQLYMLNSFVRRTDKTDELKTLIKSSGATMARQGRSRNWILTADIQQIKIISTGILEAHEVSWLWLVKLFSNNKHTWTESELLRYARDSSASTVTELMSETDCTIVEARKVIDLLEWE